MKTGHDLCLQTFSLKPSASSLQENRLSAKMSSSQSDLFVHLQKLIEDAFALVRTQSNRVQSHQPDQGEKDRRPRRVPG